jgi:putative copper export protein
VDEWTVIRFLHVVALAVFVGGQLLLVVAVVPVLRGRDEDAAMRTVARRFGIASAAALLVLIITGAAMAGHLSRWSDPILQAKLALLVLIGVLLALHVLTPYTRAVSLSVLATSILIVWLGIRLTHG